MIKAWFTLSLLILVCSTACQNQPVVHEEETTQVHKEEKTVDAVTEAPVTKAVKEEPQESKPEEPSNQFTYDIEFPLREDAQPIKLYSHSKRVVSVKNKKKDEFSDQIPERYKTGKVPMAQGMIWCPEGIGASLNATPQHTIIVDNHRSIFFCGYLDEEKTGHYKNAKQIAEFDVYMMNSKTNRYTWLYEASAVRNFILNRKSQEGLKGQRFDEILLFDEKRIFPEVWISRGIKCDAKDCIITPAQSCHFKRPKSFYHTAMNEIGYISKALQKQDGSFQKVVGAALAGNKRAKAALLKQRADLDGESADIDEWIKEMIKNWGTLCSR